MDIGVEKILYLEYLKNEIYWSYMWSNVKNEKSESLLQQQRGICSSDELNIMHALCAMWAEFSFILRSQTFSDFNSLSPAKGWRGGGGSKTRDVF